MQRNSKGSSHHLRHGRWSAAGQIYMVTAATKDRAKVFADFDTARLLIRILREDENRGSHRMLAFVIMPDHLHWLLQLQHGSLSTLIGRVKSLAARRIGQPVWQDGFHDHALRREDDLVALVRYIVANPVRAGLVERIGQYPHWDAVWL